MEIFAIVSNDGGEKIRNEDPLVFPALMSEEEAAKLPGVIL